MLILYDVNIIFSEYKLLQFISLILTEMAFYALRCTYVREDF